MKRLAALIIGFALMANSSTWAVTFYGGGDSCATFTTTQDTTQIILWTGWMMGYISGINDAANIEWNNNPPNAHAIFGAVLLHCENNPLDTVAEAVASVHVQIMTKQQ